MSYQPPYSPPPPPKKKKTMGSLGCGLALLFLFPILAILIWVVFGVMREIGCTFGPELLCGSLSRSQERYVLSQLESAYGQSFTLIDSTPSLEEFTLLIAPEDDPGYLFNAYLARTRQQEKEQGGRVADGYYHYEFESEMLEVLQSTQYFSSRRPGSYFIFSGQGKAKATDGSLSMSMTQYQAEVKVPSFIVLIPVQAPEMFDALDESQAIRDLYEELLRRQEGFASLLVYFVEASAIEEMRETLLNKKGFGETFYREEWNLFRVGYFCSDIALTMAIQSPEGVLNLDDFKFQVSNLSSKSMSSKAT